jgi:hypothetical protein
MKKFAFLAFIIVLLLPLLAACQPEVEAHTPIAVGAYTLGTINFTAADDLSATPGGITYAANVVGINSSGEQEPNPWPPIESVTKTLGNGLENITVQYRAYIESQAGQTRNNIFWITRATRFEDNNLVLYQSTRPDGIELTWAAGAGLPGTLMAILMINISPQVLPGEYMFRIIIEIDGQQYDSVPCTINVIE